MPDAWPQSDERECSNLRCITKKEKYLPAQFCKEGEADVCAYCGKPL
jgi:aspartate carbamoyltransferase regulatory subunit